MRKRLRLASLGLCVFFATGPTFAEQQIVVGWVEKVIVNDHKFTLHAKIDSGADNTSINTVNPEHFTKHGERWVRFTVTNDDGHEMLFEKPIIKTTKIKTKDGGRQHRDVIEIDLCLGNISKTVKVNLVDRSHFKYQLLVGRSFLRPDFLIDSSRKYLVEPSCGKA